MDYKEFREILRACLEKCGFIYKNKVFYTYSRDVIVAINAQKSNYDDSIYINYSFFVRNIHPDVDYPQIYEGDVRGRFRYVHAESVLDSYPLAEMSFDSLKNSIENNIICIVQPVIEGGIDRYFEIYPQARCAATKELKLYLKKTYIKK